MDSCYNNPVNAYNLEPEFVGAIISTTTMAFISSYLVGRVACLRQEVKDLRHEATHDKLTGLPNRRWLMTELTYQAENNPGDFGVLFVDVDGLKEKNDAEGHFAGDELIIDTAHELQSSIRGQDEVENQEREADKI